jgi:hypothetical protein
LRLDGDAGLEEEQVGAGGGADGDVAGAAPAEVARHAQGHDPGELGVDGIGAVAAAEIDNDDLGPALGGAGGAESGEGAAEGFDAIAGNDDDRELGPGFLPGRLGFFGGHR